MGKFALAGATWGSLSADGLHWNSIWPTLHQRTRNKYDYASGKRIRDPTSLDVLTRITGGVGSSWWRARIRWTIDQGLVGVAKALYVITYEPSLVIGLL